MTASLSELDAVWVAARPAGWDEDVAGERAALTAARRAVAQVDEYLADRLEELAASEQ